ncbi:MAG: DUF3857 domain-containing protein [Saprospiraceae bacterium]|nr:DUF3857 domain-containing protein [Saprospiraceae bacterium]
MKSILTYIAFGIFVLFDIQNLVGQFQLSTIPDTLKEDTEAIILAHNVVTEIFDKYKIKTTIKSSTMILDNNAAKPNLIYVVFDKFSKIDDLKITILSAKGKKIKTIKRGQMINQSLSGGSTIASDARIMYYQVLENNTPYIINTEYSINSKESFTINSFDPIVSPKTAILNSNYKVIHHDINNKLRFSKSIWGAPKADSSLLQKTFEWSISSLTVKRISEILKYNQEVTITPILENFQMDGYDGNLSTWQNFGIWLTNLGKGADILDSKSVEEIKQVIGDETDKKKIVDKLYQYLQHQTRYVSIQLGIGGFKPTMAQDVHNYKYGDCKALSNYMKTLLAVANIPSTYIIIKAGDKKNIIDHQFPQNTFNHAILGVPLDSDTIFLECTSQTSPAGFLGSFTGNRQALWVDGSDSKIINTKVYTHQSNKIKNEYEIYIFKDKVATLNMKQSLDGMGREHINYLFTKDFSPEKFKSHILSRLLNDAQDLEVKNRNYDVPFFEYEFKSPKYVLNSRDRFFIDLNIDKLPKEIDTDFNNLKFRKEFSVGYTIQEYFKIHIPEGCIVEKTIENQNNQYQQMDINYNIVNNQSTLDVYRTMVFKSGPFDNQEKMASYHENYKKHTASKIVLNCK